jgi:hypothetical protein
MDTVEKILTLVTIRRFTDSHMPDEMYFDVFDIKLPSEEGAYSAYDAIVCVSTMIEKNKLNELYFLTHWHIIVLCL